MGRFIKWVLIGLGGLVALLVVFALVVVVVVDPNDYRGEIEQAVEQRTGRELTINGDLDLTFFPWFGLQLGRTELADAEGFGSEPFAAVDSVQLAVKVLPLLTGNLELDTIILERPQVNLVRDEQGRANWEQFPQSERTEAGQPADGGSDSGGVPDIVRTLHLEGLEVEEARVVYDDRQAQTTVTLDPFSMELSDVQLGEPIPMEATWELALTEGPKVTGKLSGEASVADDLSHASLKPFDMEVTATGDSIPAGEQTVSLSSEMEADLDRSVYTLSDLSVKAAGATLEATAEARMADGGVVANGQAELLSVSPRDVMSNLEIAPPETRDENVLRVLSANAEFRFENGQLSVKPLQATLDDSNLNGQARVRNFSGPAADFQLTLDAINVDRYLASTSGDEPAESGDTPPGKGAEPSQLPTEPLRPLDLNGTVKVGRLIVSGAKVNDVNITIKAKNGRIRVHPLTASLYGGGYNGDVRLDATGERLGVSVDEKLSGIKAEPLLSDLAGFDRLLGTGEFSINGKTRGGDRTTLLDQLKGKARFSFSDGTVKGLNIAQMLREAVARVRGGDVKQNAGPKQTDFSNLSGTLTIDGGTVSNDDLAVKTPLLRINGSGKANLVRRTVDYLLTVNVVGTLEGQGGSDLTSLKRVPVPLRIKGDMTSPGFNLEVGEALRSAVKGRVEEKVEKQKDKAVEKAKEKLNDKLKGLLN